MNLAFEVVGDLLAVSEAGNASALESGDVNEGILAALIQHFFV